MTALMTRDALVPVAHAHAFVMDSTAYGREACDCGWRRDGFDAPTHEEHLLDALLASGAVVDAATLADDKALVRQVASPCYTEYHQRNADDKARYHLRRLAAALTVRGAS